MKKRRFLWSRCIILILPLLVGACSPASKPVVTPIIQSETPTSVAATSTPMPLKTPPATITPSPTQTPLAQPATSTPIFTPLPPNPTPIAPPDINFSADRSYIKVGMGVVFTWDVKNSRAVYFYAEGDRWENNIVAPAGSREEWRKESTTYYLRVVGLDDAVEIREIHIPVEPLPGL